MHKIYDKSSRFIKFDVAATLSIISSDVKRFIYSCCILISIELPRFSCVILARNLACSQIISTLKKPSRIPLALLQELANTGMQHIGHYRMCFLILLLMFITFEYVRNECRGGSGGHYFTGFFHMKTTNGDLNISESSQKLSIKSDVRNER